MTTAAAAGSTWTRRALVLTPFATVPLDAGHRRRCYQTTALLKRAGYHVTLLLYAFEGGWTWRFNERQYEEMRRQWDDVLLVHAEKGMGLPPRRGSLHELDEWWSPALESYLVNLFSRRAFDVFVVNNVWLSKALDFAPPPTVRILDTHDLFWRRRAILDRIGVAHDFFVPSEESELFGISRADLAIMIQEAEARDIFGRTRATVATLPFYDTALEAEGAALARANYLHPDKVTFGMLGSAHTFNVRGLQAVLSALEKRVAATFAPVEVLAGGAVGDAVETILPIRRVRDVATEAEFYRQCDFAIAPNFEGTGFKVKVADCLALGMPVIAAEHAAIGTALRGPNVVATPEQFADRMVEIALRRPALSTARAAVLAARDDLRRRTRAAERTIHKLIAGFRPHTVIDLRGFTPERGAVPLISHTVWLRERTKRSGVTVLLDPAVLALVGDVLPPAVQAVSDTGFLRQLLPAGGKVTVVAAGHAASRDWQGLPWVEVVPDPLWAWLSPPAGPAQDQPAAVEPPRGPLFRDSLWWEPAAGLLLRKARALSLKGGLGRGRADTVLFVAGLSRPSLSLDIGAEIWALDVQEPAAFEAGILYLLERRGTPVDVVWALPGRETQRDIVREACRYGGHRFHGCMDGVMVGYEPASKGEAVATRTPTVPAQGDILTNGEARRAA